MCTCLGRLGSMVNWEVSVARQASTHIGDSRDNLSDPDVDARVRGHLRAASRDLALSSALKKRSAGVPTYTVPEAAALCSVSQEHLYRLVRADAFPAVRIHGRYVVPAKAVDDLLAAATAAGGCLDAAEWATSWQPQGGAA